MTAPRVLGVDLSLTGTGIALPDGFTFTIDCESLKGLARLEYIRTSIMEYFVPRQLVVLEGFSYGSKGQSVYEIGGLGYIIRLALWDANIPFVEVPPSSLKLYATGKGLAKKTAMAVAALKRTGQEFDDDNQCDAAWLRWMALDHYGYPEFEVPATHRKALEKIVWPEIGAKT